MKRLIVFVLLALLLAIPAGALAQGGDDIPSFDVWLQGASGPFVGAIVAIVISWIVEYWPAYDKLEPRWKRMSYFLLCMVVPMVAATLRGLLGYVEWSFDPLYWHAMFNGFAAAGVGTLYHARKLPA